MNVSNNISLKYICKTPCYVYPILLRSLPGLSTQDIYVESLLKLFILLWLLFNNILKI